MAGGVYPVRARASKICTYVLPSVDSLGEPSVGTAVSQMTTSPLSWLPIRDRLRILLSYQRGVDFGRSVCRLSFGCVERAIRDGGRRVCTIATL